MHVAAIPQRAEQEAHVDADALRALRRRWQGILKICRFLACFRSASIFPIAPSPTFAAKFCGNWARASSVRACSAGAPHRHRRRQPGHCEYRDHHARGRGLLEIARRAARSFSPPWAATAAQPPKAKPTCWRTTAFTKPPWTVRWSARWMWFPPAGHREGIETFMDRSAFESDGVMLIGRVKWHTDFSGKLESGLFKMTAIGLGKFAGAQRYHVLRLQARPGARHPHRGTPGDHLGQDPGRPGHSRRRQSQHRPDQPRCLPTRWSGPMRNC